MRSLVFTKEILESLASKFQEEILKMDKYTLNSEIKISVKIPEEKPAEKMHVEMTKNAYKKMRMLVDDFSKEIAWYGVTDRISDNEFLITDILVYPQTVSGASVNVDTGNYAEWADNLDDEVRNKLRFQGHSHVNMAVSPSSTDIDHQMGQFRELMGDDEYFIFIITNKKGDNWFRIYDKKTGYIYEKADIEFIYDDESEYDDFVKTARDLVKDEFAVKKSYTNYTGYNYSSYFEDDYDYDFGYKGYTTTKKGKGKK